MMQLTRTGPAWLLFTATSVVALSGCEDPSAELRTEAQRTITTASVDYRRATAGNVSPGDDEFDAVQQSLTSVSDRLSNLPDAAPGQQAAASLLAADAQLELAGMNLAQAMRLQRSHSLALQDMHSSVRAAARLEAMAEAQESVETTAAREQLQQARQEAEEALAQLNERIAALNEPIEDRSERNEQDAEEARQLREEAADLLRRARELGHANGFLNFQQGVSTRRDADEIEYGISLREIELDYELQPEHRLAELQLDQTQQVIEAIRRTLDEFDAMEQTYRQDMEATREEIQSLSRSVSESLEELSSSIDGELKEQLDQARSHIERATTLASQAAGRLRGEQGNAARLAHAKALALKARLEAAAARGVSDHRTLLDSIAQNARSLLSSDWLEARLDELAASHSELLESTKASFEQAEQALGQVTGQAAAAATSLREQLQETAAALTEDRATSP